MSIKYFRDKEPRPFRAVQYDGENAEEIIDFCKGAAFFHLAPFDCFGQPSLHLREPDMTEEIPVGYWVIEGDDKSFYMTYEPGEFEEDFERAAYMESE